MADFLKYMHRAVKPSIARKYMRELESGCFEMPKTMDVLARYPAEDLSLVRGAAMRVSFPEDRLIKQLYEREPRVKQQPIALNSFTKPLEKEFALAQLRQQRQARQTEEEAYSVVRWERMAERFDALSKNQLSGDAYIALAQKAEQRELNKALAVLAGKAPPPVKSR